MWVALAAVALLLAGGWARLLSARRRGRWAEPTPPPAAEAMLDPADLDDVAARMQAVDTTEVRGRHELLASRLRPLIDKRVPLRVVEPVPGLQSVRVRFADGTALVGHGESPGDAGVLASALGRRQAVWVGSWATDERGTHLRFVLSADRQRRLVFVVTGLDQPD